MYSICCLRVQIMADNALCYVSCERAQDLVYMSTFVYIYEGVCICACVSECECTCRYTYVNVSQHINVIT